MGLALTTERAGTPAGVLLRALSPLSRRGLAKALGHSPALVSKWLEKGSGGPNLGHVLRMPRAVALRLLNEVAAQHGACVVELPEAGEVKSGTYAAETLKEYGEFLGEVSAAMADGHVCRAEGGRLEAEGMDVVRLVMAAVVLGRQAQREGVVGVTG